MQCAKSIEMRFVCLSFSLSLSADNALRVCDGKKGESGTENTRGTFLKQRNGNRKVRKNTEIENCKVAASEVKCSFG